MKRLVNSSLYGNKYLPDEILQDLNSAVFVENENPDTFKRNLQSTYVDLLIDGFSEAPYDEVSKTAIYATLKEILKFAGKQRFKSNHYDFIYFKLNKFFESN